MKYTIVASFLAVLAVAETVDQLVAQIPTCAVTCIRDGAQSVNCDVEDFACSCGKVTQLTATVVPCLASSGCSSADQATVLQLATQICAQVGSSSASAGSGTAAATTSTGTKTSSSSSHSGTATEAAVASTTSPAAAGGRAQVAGWAGAIAAAAAFAL
ncbi:hypothetical protein CORC01_07203 [Colletotrichum orchidophilum]|uniref:CFEM domain-containing protein n=1 Tax=Colletotrichum orchidophilum TaxID=1209926 RepID=A0A1G4B811_9PEZI|nr:uncharacterized protein CORC01_07203 [Colletotrichum orchidophilum]OHE97588.1 hypothetical protein CORC01_07203 [Colletotrichum orchidophilum]